jgi:amino acid adenylation domain-containing protein
VIQRENLQDLYPLAPMQEGMLLEWLLEPDSLAYREQVTYRLRGTLDVARLEGCWRELVRRHAALRTVFVHDKAARPLQMVLKEVPVRWRFEDLGHVPREEREERAAALRREERGRAFDLAAEPASRIAVLRLDAEAHQVVWTFHHILLDGWSVGLVIADLLRLYAGGGNVPPAPLPYSRYIQWLEARDTEEDRRYWRQALAGYHGPASIPSSRPGWQLREYAAQQLAWRFAPAEYQALERCAGACQVTPGALLKTLWAILLGRYQVAPADAARRRDLAFGIVVSGRPASVAGIEAMVGLFTNTVPLRLAFDEDETLAVLAARVQADVVAAQEHAHLPLAQLQAVHGAIDHLVAWENFPRDAGVASAMAGGDLGFRLEGASGEAQVPYDLNVVFEPGEALTASFHFNASRYAPAQVERLFAQLRTLVLAAAASPLARVGELEAVGGEERALLRAFELTRVERPGPGTLHEAIGERIRAAPEAVAVIEGDRETSYAELDRLATALATALRVRHGLAPGGRVAVLLERSAQLAVAWLGILRAGGVYLPIDPALPQERIAFMLADAGCAVALRAADVARLVEEGAGLAPLPVAPAQLCAYVIYTSGSTGVPKGVAVGHAGVLNLMAHLAELQPLGAGDRVMFFSSPSFDASIWEMNQALCHGAALVVADRETVADPARFGALLRRSACTVAVLPPAYVRLLEPADFASFKLLATGGEAAHPETATTMSARVRFANLYGPTEASIQISTYEVAPGERFTRSVPIGRPIPNVEALVLDDRGRRVPIGAPGELCAGGVALALGYVGRPGLDAERFTPHPFSPGERIYRTGDLVRWLDDGTLEFAGRIDEQVKVRGHRVEPGEVQARLQSCPGVRQAAVVALRDGAGDTELVAYVVAGGAESLADLPRHLRDVLPEYMLPARYIALDALPLTPQGKLDRARLPQEAPAAARHLDPPADAFEARLAAAWAAVLGVGEVGVNESFFDLGGHSLTAVRLAARVRKELGIALEVRELFAHPTVATLAHLLRGRAGADPRPIARLPEAQHYEVTSAQRRLWLLHNSGAAGAAYNIAGAFAIDGALDRAALERAAAALVARHEALRTTFVQVDAEPRQRVHAGPVAPPLELLDVSAADDPAAEAAGIVRVAQERVFDLDHGPLMRMLLVREGPVRHRLAVVLHHIIADEWSVQVMTRELGELYAAFAAGREPRLEPLALRPRDVAAWLNARPLEVAAAYWQRRLGGTLPVLDLPGDRPRPPRRSYRGAVVAATVPGEAFRAMAAMARSEQATLFMALVAAVKVLLARYSGSRDILVGHPAAAREHPGLEAQVGFYVNTVALRDELHPQQSFRELLVAVRRTVLEGMEHQAYPFDLLVESLGVPRDASRHPVFDVMVAYERASAEELRLAGATVRPVPAAEGTSKFDLLFAFREDAASLRLSIEYSTDLFDPGTIERLQRHFATLLGAIAAAPDAPLAELALVAPEEARGRATHGDAAAATDERESLVSRFARSVATHRDALAVVAGAERLTYGELAARAEALAGALARDGAGRDVPVGLLLDRSADMVSGMLGILEAGAAYLPLDPALPSPRLAAMLADAGARSIVTDGRHATLAAGLGAAVIRVDVHDRTAAPGERAEVKGSDLAYLLYTSGSTGKPNGVMVEHRNVLALLDAFERLAPRGAALSGVALCPFGFDVSVWEIFSCLTTGGTLHLLPGGADADAAGLVRYFREHGITSAYLPPGLIDAVGAELARSGAPLDRLLVGVEPIPQGALQRLCDAVPELRIVNGYGPTEATVCATFHLHRAGGDPEARTPIGRAAAGYEVHLLDADMQPVPEGVVGEVYVGGAGLARGYAGNASLTAWRFLPNPFAAGRGARLYRTGDLARRLPDGSLVFIGRADYQVKVRGYRIEPGEIEAALRAHPAVREAAVLVREAPGRGRELVAYLGCAPGAALDPRAHLRARLPEYMVPAAFVPMAALPRTPNGKLDREALARLVPAEAARAATPPATATEATLQRLWSEVLARESVGCDESFFDLGGHSLIATRLLGRIREACGVELPLRDLFEAPTVREAAARLDAMARGDGLAQPIFPVPRTGPLPLSFAQQRLWFLEQLEPGAAYNVPVALEIEGVLDAARLEAALNAVIARHEALRTRFVAIDGTPAQEVLAERPVAFAHVDLTGSDPARAADDVRDRMAGLAARPFDLAAQPLLRAALVTLAGSRHVLLLSIHHIVIDGWSMGVLLRELGALYQGERLEPPALQYADYAAWQRDAGNAAALHTQLDYWRARLAGLPPLLELPTDRPRGVQHAKPAGIERFTIAPALAESLRQRARELGATGFMVMLAALAVVLARASGQRDIAVGTPIANRTRPELQPLVGFFANTVVVRVDLEGEPGFSEVVRRVREATLEAQAHQDVPFDQVVGALQPERSLAHTPLFQVLFVWQDRPLEQVALPGLAIRALEQPATEAKFDLTVAIEERGGALAGAIEYDAGLFDPATIRGLAAQLGTLLAAALADPAAPASRLPLLTPAQRRELVVESAGNAPAAGRGDNALQCVAAQVGRTPAAAAIEDGATVLTYAELETRANRLAHHLRARGARPGLPVGLCVPRSADMLVALLAIVKSGAAVVPLDPSYPAERLAAMLRDAAAPLVVQRGADLGARAVDLDRDRAAIDALPATVPADTAAPDDPLYILFTSGSTGVPKGAVVPHRVIANLVAWGRAGQGFAAPARTLQFTPVSFDVAFQEIFATWASGGTLVVIDDDRRRDAFALLRCLREARIERLFLPFVALQGLAEAAAEVRDDELPGRLAQVITAGEQLRTTAALVDFFRRLPACELHNHYGPTETHVITAHRLSGPPAGWPKLPPIGRALAGARLYVLDEHREPVPPGMPGELYAGGIVVALGYVNRPELTAERFVPDPFGAGLLYRTGDRVRRRADGEFEFLGRADAQLKVRGFRVEPAEVEAWLMRHPGVAQAAVALAESRLVGYIVPAPGAPPDPEALRGFLREHLPEYMVPAAFAMLPRLPLTSSGKLDRRQLARIAPGEHARGERLPPRTATERVLAGLYAEVLGLPAVGRDESFFELGGHSLLAARLAARVRRALGVELPLRRLFEAPSVEALARAVEAAPRVAGDSAPLVPVDRTGPLPLSFAQERFWFVDRLGGGAAFNMPAAARLRGALDADALQRALDALVERHEMLRTAFVERGGVPAQLVVHGLRVVIDRRDAVSVEEARGIAQRLADTPFDLAQAPLMRVALLRTAPGEHVLVIVLHHILADGWSLATLTLELAQLYAAFAAGRAAALPPLALQYGDFAAWQRGAGAQLALAPQREYWASQLAGAPASVPLPADHARTGAPSLRGGTIRFAFDAGLTGALRALARRTHTTLHATLLAAFAALLYRVSGQEDLTIGTPAGHRARPELEPLAGLFLNLLPIRIACPPQASVEALCRAVQERTLDAFAHGELPFEQIVEAAGGRGVEGHAPLFNVMFVMQQAVSLTLAGLEVEALELDAVVAKYDLTLAIEEGPRGIAGGLEYAGDLFEVATAAELAGAFQDVVRAMAADPAAQIIALPLGTAHPARTADADDFAFGGARC